jgi:hypothetical protein
MHSFFRRYIYSSQIPHPVHAQVALRRFGFEPAGSADGPSVLAGAGSEVFPFLATRSFLEGLLLDPLGTDLGCFPLPFL